MRANKYRAKRTYCREDHCHGSRREARRCDELHLMLRAGEIEDLQIEPQFWFEIGGNVLRHENGRRVGYKADFAYTDRREALRVVEDAKGMSVRDWPLRKAVFRALYPSLLLREV